MSYQPNVGLASSSATDTNAPMDEAQLSQRVRLVAGMNPYMAQNAQALVQMALSPMNTEDLVATAGQHYAMQTGNALADQLKGMSGGAQRAIYAQLQPGQQQALVQMGYKAPQRDEGGILSEIANVAKTPLSLLNKGGGYIVKPIITPVLEGLNWVGNWPGHLYRADRLQSDQSQWLGLAGGLVGLAAVALAIPTGGGSLMALGALGLGALGGATAAEFSSNPGDWIRAFNASGNGERTFDPRAQQQVQDLLGDPKLVGAAHDLAASGVNVVEFAKEVAGNRAIDRNSQMKQMEKFANGMATPGTPAWQRVVGQLTTALGDPTFQQAVQTLNNSKISPGRDLGRSLGLQPGTGLYSFVSGMTDATFTMAVDPTLMLGYGTELYKAKKYTFAAFEGSEAATEFRSFVKARPAVMNNYHALAAAVDAGEHGGIQALRVRAPQMEALYGDLVEYKQLLEQTGALKAPFSADNVINYIADEAKFAPLLDGRGAVKNVRGVQLIHASAGKMAFREFRGEVRALVNGMADVSTEARYAKLVAEHGPQEAVVEAVTDLARKKGVDFEALAPPSMLDKIGEDGVIAQPWRFNQHNPTGYVIGRAFADTARKVPILGRSVGRVGEALTSMTTMSIAGKAIHIAGPEAPKEIRALSELGRYMGMPSYLRQAWADTILQSDSPAARYSAVHGWLANMLRTTGIDATEEGSALVDRYLQAERKLYGASDTILVNGEPMHAGIFLNEQADMVVMPNLREMRRAAVSGHMAKLMGIADAPVIEAGISKVWKPAVLLRIGFIPRAAGEETASFILRGGLGSLGQEAGSRYLGRLDAYQDALRRQAAGPFVAKFTQAEQALLDGGLYSTLPAHVRPLVRMLARVGWEDPALAHFNDYGRWLADQLRNGAGRLTSVEDKLAGIAGQALDAPRYVSPEAGPMASLLGRTGGDREARLLGITPLDTRQLMRLNAVDYVNAIFLGNPYSLRRMMLGGVHSDLVEAGMEWAKTHSTTVMRETSSLNAGFLDPGNDAEQLHKSLVIDPKTGALRRDTLHEIRGARVTYARGDSYYANALHEGITRPMADPAMARNLEQYLTRLASPNVTEKPLGAAADALWEMGRHIEDPANIPGSLARGTQARRIMREFLGPFDRDSFDGMVAKLAASDTGAPIAQALESRLPTMGDISLKQVLSALDAHKKMIIGEHTEQFRALSGAVPQDLIKAHFEELNHVTKLMDDLAIGRKSVLGYLEKLPYADRQMAAQFLDHTIVAGDKSIWAQRKLALENERIANVTADATRAAPSGPRDLSSLDAVAKGAPIKPMTIGDKGAPEVTADKAIAAFDQLRERSISPHSMGLDADSDFGIDETAYQFGNHQVDNVVRALENHPGLTESDKRVLVEIRGMRTVDRFSAIDPQQLAETQRYYGGVSGQGLGNTHLDSVMNRESIGLFHDLGDIVDRLFPRQQAVRSAAAGSLTSDQWLHHRLDELTPERIDHLTSLIMNANLHDAGVTKTLRGVQTDEAGRAIGTELKGATSTIYEAPDLRGMTYEQILANSNNRELIAANQHVIQQVIDHPNDATALLANHQLAAELHQIDARVAGVASESAVRPRQMRVDRKVADGRVHGALVPDTISKQGKETQLWHYPRKHADLRLEPTPEVAVDKARDIATQMIARHNDVIRRGNTEWLVAKGRVTEEGGKAPLVYRWDNGEHIPIEPGTRIDPSWRNQLVDAHGLPVPYEDSRYLEHGPISTAPQDDVMWEAVGPAMRDVHANLHGETMLRRKRITANPTSGEYHLPSQLIQSHDVTPVMRAKVSDLDMIPGTDKPSNAIGELYKSQAVGKWDAFINFGFDRVIGPSIDALIRRPMSYHAFANRYINAKQALAWTLDPELVAKTTDLITQYAGHAHGIDLNPETLARQARSIASFQGDAHATKWSTNEAMAWLRGHDQEGMANILTNTLTRAEGRTDVAARSASAYARQLAKQDFTKVQGALQSGTDLPSLLTTVQHLLPEGALRSARALQSRDAKAAIEASPLLSWINKNDHWDTVMAASKNYDHIKQTAGELAAVAAIGDVTPYVHSSEFKTQFADYGRGILPFWYAEENFMKRWGRGLNEVGPALIRRAQLTYMGMKEAGVVRTDAAGKDWFVYPGSGLLVDALSNIPGLSGLQNAGIMFESPVDQMLPGVNSHFGTPSFSPLVTIPMALVTTLAPELMPATRAMEGDFASGQPVVNQLIPAHFRNIYSALTGAPNSDTRMASAMTSAIAYLQAHGDGLPDNATPGQTQQFLDRVANHARIISLVRGIGGFIVPGTPSEIVAGKSANVLGLDIKDPANYLSAEYLQLVRELGVEAGTAKYLELNKDASIDDVVSPLAYTVPRNASTSGAPIPNTEQALSFYDQNANYMHEFPNAGAWLLPQTGTDEYSQYAADQQTVNGLRKRRSPEEFLNATLFKTASRGYFATQDVYNAKIDQAVTSGDNKLATDLRSELLWKQQIYRLAHPIFTTILQSSDGRAQRLKTLDEMRQVINDPQHPQTPQFEGIAQATRVFDSYRTRLAVLGNDTSTKGRAEVEHLKTQYSSYMNALTSTNPAIMSYWVSVLRPESSL